MQEEKRASKRTQLGGRIQLHMIQREEALTVDAEIINVSRDGVGFFTSEQLLIGDCYEADLLLWTKESIKAYLKIVRAEEVENGYNYGCTFFGMQKNELMRITIYQLLQEQNGSSEV